ncbi:mechanosensitive ion channel family protein [Shewanella sp. GXUN23E]|uniref:mechanosensitive ion channel family protein n=1 Tax=Shewanella sp. GXUN23E TaxID=3422498 RepID=UPI003D7EBC37
MINVLILLLVMALPGTASANSADVLQLLTNEPLNTQALPAVAPEYQYRDKLQRDTPRGALNGFLTAAYQQDYEKAAKFLDTRFLPQQLSKAQEAEYARQLHAIIERNLWLNLDDIDDSPDGFANDALPAFRDQFGSITIQDREIPLLLQRVPDAQLDKIWKISNATVAQVPVLYEELGYGPLSEWLIAVIPSGHLFKVNLWEIALLLIYLSSAFLIVWPLTFVSAWVLRKASFPISQDLAAVISGPLFAFLALSLDQLLLQNVTLTAASQAIVNYGVLFFFSSLWLGWAAIGLLQHGIKKRLADNGNKHAAAMVRPMLTFVRIILVCFAIILWMEYRGFNATALLAGMGVGGVALALASKQTLENFIGTMTLYSAAPLKVGNLCSFGGIRGTIEEIGLRSTKVRTIDRTLIFVPNAKLAEMEIENISEREKIRFTTDLRLEYGTSTAQLRCIIDDIKALLESHEKVNKSPLRVTFKGFGAYGLEVNIFAYVGTKSLPDYQYAAQELNLGIMEIVEKHGSQIVAAPFDGAGGK